MSSSALVLAAGDGTKQVSAVAGGEDGANATRLSGLAAPTMQLRGHRGAVLCARFSPDGALLVTAGMDRTVRLWDVYARDCRNTLTLGGHGAAVLDVAWAPDGAALVTASADRTLALWDAATGARLRRFAGHRHAVNACAVPRPWRTDALYDDALLCRADVARPLFASVGDDAAARVWDPRAGTRHCSAVAHRHTCPLTACTFGADAADTLFVAGLDGTVLGLDLRRLSSDGGSEGSTTSATSTGAAAAVRLTLSGHRDTVTGLALSRDGAFVLSNAMDAQLRVWDVRPYAPATRCVKILVGHTHGAERNLLRCAWAPSSRHVAAGSSDGVVSVWSTTSRAVVHRLAGHAGSVNDVAFSPREPVLASAGSDGTVILGEVLL